MVTKMHWTDTTRQAEVALNGPIWLVLTQKSSARIIWHRFYSPIHIKHTELTNESLPLVENIQAFRTTSFLWRCRNSVTSIDITISVPC